MDRSNSVAYMTSYLKYALEFERYIYIWRNALNDTNRSIENLRKQKEGLETAHQTATYSLKTIDSRYSEEIKKDRISLLRSQFWAIVSAVALFVFSAFLLLIIIDSDSQIVKSAQKLLSAETTNDIAGVSIYGLVFSFVVLIWQGQKSVKIGKRLSAQRRNNTLGKMKENLISKQKQAEGGKKYVVVSQTKAVAQKNSIAKELREAQSTLSEVYSLDVLPLKYRNFEAVATLYEYLVTGRCTDIKGHGGIYDTYEKDCQSGIIISKLSQIQNSLERIEENQRVLYTEVQKANQTLYVIRQSLSSIESSNRQIMENTAITAVASQQSAAALNWMMWNR